MLGSARGRWCNSSGLLTQLLTRRRSFGMGLFIDKPGQGRLVSSRLVSLLLLVAAPAGRAVDLARASHRIKRRNAPPTPLVFQCRLSAMTPWLAGAVRPQQQQRSPRALELHRRPDGDVGQQPQRRPGGPRPTRRSPRPRTELSENGIGDGVLVAAPAGRTVDLVRASQWIKRRNAPNALGVV